MESLNTVDNVLRVIQIIALVGSLTVSVWLWHRGRNDKVIETLKAADADLARKVGDVSNTIMTRLAAHTARDATFDTRIAVIETTIRHLPTHGDLQAIQRELRDLNGSVAAVSERSEATLEMVRTIQEHLLESK